MVTAALVVLFAMVMLVIDGGRLFAHHARLQDAADAAALYGARGLQEGDWAARVDQALADHQLPYFAPQR